MAGELFGLEFGTYDGMFSSIQSQYTVKPNQNPQERGNTHEFTFFDKNKGNVKGNGYRQKLIFAKEHEASFAHAVIFKDGFEYGTGGRTEDKLNTFDYIVGKGEYAIDLNGNGKVDNDEVFTGHFDRFSYKKAKDDGDLNKYQEYYKQYN